MSIDGATELCRFKRNRYTLLVIMLFNTTIVTYERKGHLRYSLAICKDRLNASSTVDTNSGEITGVRILFESPAGHFVFKDHIGVDEKRF